MQPNSSSCCTCTNSFCSRSIGSCQPELPHGRRTSRLKHVAHPRRNRTGRVAARGEGRFPANLPVSPRLKCSRNPLHRSCPTGTTSMQPVLAGCCSGKSRVVRCAAGRCKCTNSIFTGPARRVRRKHPNRKLQGRSDHHVVTHQYRWQLAIRPRSTRVNWRHPAG